MPCWRLEWMVGKRSAAWTTSFWASATELVWFCKMYGQRRHHTQHIKPFKTQNLHEYLTVSMCFTSFLVKVISAVSRSRVNLILLKSAKHCWCCEIRISELYSICTFKTTVLLLLYLKLKGAQLQLLLFTILTSSSTSGFLCSPCRLRVLCVKKGKQDK